MRGLQLVGSATKSQSGKMVVSDWGRGSATSDEVAGEELSEEVWDLKDENGEDVGNATPGRGNRECQGPEEDRAWHVEGRERR